jgi:hypothetical protein
MLATMATANARRFESKLASVPAGAVRALRSAPKTAPEALPTAIALSLARMLS